MGVGIVRIPDSEGNNQSIKTTQLHALELEFQFLFLKTERRYLMGFVFQQFWALVSQIKNRQGNIFFFFFQDRFSLFCFYSPYIVSVNLKPMILIDSEIDFV